MIAQLKKELDLTEMVLLNPELKSSRGREFEQMLSNRIIGQQRAVQRMSGLYQMFLAGMSPVGRPIGTMLFLGPTGTGKTRVVEAAAEVRVIQRFAGKWATSSSSCSLPYPTQFQTGGVSLYGKIFN